MAKVFNWAIRHVRVCVGVKNTYRLVRIRYAILDEMSHGD